MQKDVTYYFGIINSYLIKICLIHAYPSYKKTAYLYYTLNMKFARTGSNWILISVINVLADFKCDDNGFLELEIADDEKAAG